MANRNVIVIKKPDMIINPAYLDRAVKDTTYMGIAMVLDGKLIVDRRKGVPTVKAVMDVQTDEALKKLQIVFCFGENQTILDEDMQPFEIVVDKASDSRIAVTFEGNFPGYTMKGSSHTNEWHCKEEFLTPKLQKLFKIGGGLTGLLAELNDPVTQQDFSNSWTDRGFMNFLTSEGEAVTIANKGHVFMGEFPWGRTSHTINYTEKDDAPKIEAAKPLTALERIKAKMAGKPEGLAEDKTATAMAAAVDEWEEVKLPDEAKDQTKWTNKVKSQWWINEIGYQPEGYKLMTTKVKRKKGTKIGILAPLAASNVKDAATPGTEERDLKVDPKTLPEKTAPEGIKDIEAKHVTMDNLPIISPKQKMKIKSEWLTDTEVIKTLGDDFKAMAFDPKKLKEFEDNHQTFGDGLGLDEANMWLSFEALMKLGILDIKALAVYAFNKQNSGLKAQLQLNHILANPTSKTASRVAL